MSVIIDIEDLCCLVCKCVLWMFYDYVDFGFWSEGIYCVNQDDFVVIKLCQWVVWNIENCLLCICMFGQEMVMLVVIVFIGLVGMQYVDGEIFVVCVVVEFGVCYILLIMSICFLEDIVMEVGQLFWFQFYVMCDCDFIECLIDCVKVVGCDVLVLIFDLQIIGQCYKDLKNGFLVLLWLILVNLLNIVIKLCWVLGMFGIWCCGFGNIVGYVKGVDDMGLLFEWIVCQFDLWLNWGDVEWIKWCWGGKLVFKGIFDVEDVWLVVDFGVDVLVVSNYGGC